MMPQARATGTLLLLVGVLAGCSAPQAAHEEPMIDSARAGSFAACLGKAPPSEIAVYLTRLADADPRGRLLAEFMIACPRRMEIDEIRSLGDTLSMTDSMQIRDRRSWRRSNSAPFDADEDSAAGERIGDGSFSENICRFGPFSPAIPLRDDGTLFVVQFRFTRPGMTRASQIECIFLESAVIYDALRAVRPLDVARMQMVELSDAPLSRPVLTCEDVARLKFH